MNGEGRLDAGRPLLFVSSLLMSTSICSEPLVGRASYPYRMRLSVSLAAVLAILVGSSGVRAQARDSLRVPVLVYHSVMPHHAGQTREQRILDVDDSVFVEQMQYLASGGYHVVSLGALVDALEGKAQLPRRAVVITFDDGWANQYHHALPILRRFGATATFFVFTSVIASDKRNMTWKQLAELQAAGMSIGSHTRTHPSLPHSHRTLRDEVQLSRDDIAKHLGRVPEFFAYPFGDWDKESADWTKRAGYRAARTYRGGAWNSSADRYHLRAIPVTDNMQKFERAISGH